MKVQILSDLHLEGARAPFLENFEPTGDVLILAGDVTNAKSMDLLKTYFSDIKIPIVYILGNHEYYGGSYYDSPKNYAEYLKDNVPNITLLNDSFVDIQGVRFLGSTYWSNISPLEEYDTDRYISDFKSYYNRDQELHPLVAGLTVNKHREAHLNSTGFLKHAMSEARDKGIEKTVIVTHFPPSYRAQEERFKLSGLSSYFYNNDDDLVELLNPSLWVYGHTHGNLRFKIGDVPVECNQYGYTGKNGPEPCRTLFNPNYCVEV